MRKIIVHLKLKSDIWGLYYQWYGQWDRNKVMHRPHHQAYYDYDTGEKEFYHIEELIETEDEES